MQEARGSTPLTSTWIRIEEKAFPLGRAFFVDAIASPGERRFSHYTTFRERVAEGRVRVT
jgi:hypothetical protein